MISTTIYDDDDLDDVDCDLCLNGGGGGGGGGEEGLTCICHDTRMCHYFGYLLGVLQDFWVPISTIPRSLGVIFLSKFDFFRNNPDFWVLILIFSYDIVLYIFY